MDYLSCLSFERSTSIGATALVFGTSEIGSAFPVCSTCRASPATSGSNRPNTVSRLPLEMARRPTISSICLNLIVLCEKDCHRLRVHVHI